MLLAHPSATNGIVFVWLRLYLSDLDVPRRPAEPLWWTLRRRNRGGGLQRQPLNYEALRAVLRRTNTTLGTSCSDQRWGGRRDGSSEVTV